MSRLPQWKEFGVALSGAGIRCLVVNNTDVADGFPTKKIHRWRGSTKRFDDLVREFDPDAIITDGLRHFGMFAARSDVPLITYLAGDFWAETRCARQTTYRSFPKSMVIGRLEKMAATILQDSKMIVTPSKYLARIVNGRLADKPIYVLPRPMDPLVWHPREGMQLEHPCVGMVQNATIWDKAKEMLILHGVLEKLPHVMFYWAGGGPHAKEILRALGKYSNFRWLGPLGYPNEVQRFLSEIDVYTLLTGLDAAPVSLREALLMEKPVVATNVGGVPEIVDGGESGLLVDAGDQKGVVEKISYLLENAEVAAEMGRRGRKKTVEETNGEYIARGFVRYVRENLGM